MTQTRTEARRRAGILADGGFKLLLAAVFGAGAAPLGDRLGVPVWLMVSCGVALLVGGGAELGYARRRPLRLYTRLMVGYDAGWVLAALAGLLLTRRGSGAGGEVWIGYQALAPLVFAALLAAAAPSPEDPR
ncbi:hypothetical protein [Streptomyces rubellomurinus]|uniref:Integral membrane protein n=2 Tax=Streptomyces TaxID=1883 RepID=A0A0F2T8E6_STRR3|nr:hypothetical protein [Streptomyces rubellomurinus]KJS56223.1 hypothetical protein VM98_08655 [Streptomyces rubellomurinus subsp. indigoferus]KJS58701.1 hypothetical protein VM95_31730 [Streptomyces rubellomurinus]